MDEAAPRIRLAAIPEQPAGRSCEIIRRFLCFYCQNFVAFFRQDFYLKERSKRWVGRRLLRALLVSRPCHLVSGRRFSLWFVVVSATIHNKGIIIVGPDHSNW